MRTYVGEILKKRAQESGVSLEELCHWVGIPADTAFIDTDQYAYLEDQLNLFFGDRDQIVHVLVKRLEAKWEGKSLNVQELFPHLYQMDGTWYCPREYRDAFILFAVDNLQATNA